MGADSEPDAGTGDALEVQREQVVKHAQEADLIPFGEGRRVEQCAGPVGHCSISPGAGVCCCSVPLRVFSQDASRPRKCRVHWRLAVSVENGAETATFASSCVEGP